jgi:hypothetical protein
MIGLPLEKRLAILAEYDAGDISHAELAAKHGIGESTISGWRRRMPCVERKCTVCGAVPPPKAVAWRGSLLCRACSRAKKTATHRVYYRAHKEEIDAANTYAKQSSLSKAIGRDRCAERWFRNEETLKRLLKKMIDRYVDWDDDYSLVGREQLNNPIFIVVSKSGAKRKEVLTEPLPSWD